MNNLTFHCKLRFTPAYAGKISDDMRANFRSQVHPRIRGEDCFPRKGDFERRGSPPHTRGRFDCLPEAYEQLRFTPAYAGKIRIWVLSEFIRKVHPRIRGEDHSEED